MRAVPPKILVVANVAATHENLIAIATTGVCALLLVLGFVWLHAHGEKVQAERKAEKERMVAVMRKMLIIAHALVKNNEKWQNKMVKKITEH